MDKNRFLFIYVVYGNVSPDTENDKSINSFSKHCSKYEI